MTAANKKVALVTGAGRGLGANLAERLGAAGYAVALHYRSSRAGAEQAAATLQARGRAAAIFSADLSRQAEAENLIAEVMTAFGQIDVLINNSGIYQPLPLHQINEEEWLTGLHSTVTAAFFTTRAALPWLRQSGAGRILNIGDSSCDRPTARDLALSYHIGKTGVWMLTRSLAAAEARHGVTCNMISPGYLENSLGLPDPAHLPAGRYGTFDDIWAAVRFFLPPETNYITGTNVVVSGGWNLR